jgi:DNA-binding transcriptional regulator YdaS (Cro superfamily)
MEDDDTSGTKRYPKLQAYLASLSAAEKEAFAERLDTSIGYLRKTMSSKQKFGEKLAIDIERESGGFVPCEELRPDVDWAYLRNSDAGPASTPISRTV